MHLISQKQLASRTEEFQKLQMQARSEHSESLQAKLHVIARVNRREKASFDRNLQEVIYSRNGDMAEQQYAYAQLQEKIDTYKTAMQEMRVKVLLASDEIASMQTTIGNFEMSMSEITTEKERMAVELNATRAKLSNAEQIIEQHTREAMHMEQQLTSMRQQQDSSSVDEQRLNDALSQCKMFEAQQSKTEAKLHKVCNRSMFMFVLIYSRRC